MVRVRIAGTVWASCIVFGGVFLLGLAVSLSVLVLY